MLLRSWSSVVLPKLSVMASSRARSGCASASKMARMSSMPGSVSMMRGAGDAGAGGNDMTAPSLWRTGGSDQREREREAATRAGSAVWWPTSFKQRLPTQPGPLFVLVSIGCAAMPTRGFPPAAGALSSRSLSSPSPLFSPHACRYTRHRSWPQGVLLA